MATKVDLEFVEGSAETVAFTIASESATEDLTAVASLRFTLKADGCDDDTDAEAVLTTADPTQMQFLTHTPEQITGEAYVPALVDAYPRVYRIDTISGSGDPRTALYGRATVINV